MSVEVRIDQLVLHGFPSGQEARIGAAVERELARRLARPAPSLRRDAVVDRVDGGQFVMPAPAVTMTASAAEPVGRRIARATYGGLVRS